MSPLHQQTAAPVGAGEGALQTTSGQNLAQVARSGGPSPHHSPRDRGWGGQGPCFLQFSPPPTPQPPTPRGSRGKQDRNPNSRLTFLLLLQGVHAGKVAGQRLEGGGEAAPALGALHGAPRGAGAPQALSAHLGRSPALPAVQDARRLGGWGAAPAARRGPGWGRARPWGSGPRLPGAAQTWLSGLPGPPPVGPQPRRADAGGGGGGRRRSCSRGESAGSPGGRRGSRRRWLQEARCPPRVGRCC